MTHKPLPEVGGQPCSACGMLNCNSRPCTSSVLSALGLFVWLFQPMAFLMKCWCWIPEGLSSLTPPFQLPKEQGFLRALPPSLCPKFLTLKGLVSASFSFSVLTSAWSVVQICGCSCRESTFYLSCAWSKHFSMASSHVCVFCTHPSCVIWVKDLTSPTSH